MPRQLSPINPPRGRGEGRRAGGKERQGSLRSLINLVCLVALSAPGGRRLEIAQFVRSITDSWHSRSPMCMVRDYAATSQNCLVRAPDELVDAPVLKRKWRVRFTR